ncbi:MAG TPA: DNA starvation/stationary phase protection protein Dps [Pyrinomonadaceae bacterium]|nr:DNA starvation/stationary phase protection protein Dps [Pyrinomonadaceae bacterium]
MSKLKTYKTRIDLPAEVREQVITLLNQQLADTFDLYSQAKQAHWNVKGPEFFQLHELFDKLAAEATGFVDLIAERVTALGGTATGTVRMSAAASRLDEYPLDVSPPLSSIEALVRAYASLVETTREAIATAERAGDADTADLFTEVSRGLDKSLWFLEAHLQSPNNPSMTA